MTSTVKETSELPGQRLLDQGGRPIGKIEALYVERDGETPQWLTVDASVTMFRRRTVFVPLARVKEEEEGRLLVPYDKGHIIEAPDVDVDEALSPEDEQRLRDHYGLGRGDEEIRADGDSYAARVPDQAEGAEREADEG